MPPSPTGPQYPTVANGGTGTLAWSNPNNIFADDGSDATAGGINGITQLLKGSGYGFSVPSTAIIDGILVEVKRGGTTSTDSTCQLMKAGSTTGSNRATGTSIPGTDTYRQFGGATDLWGTSWSPADINNSGFGVAYSASITSSGSVQVDTIRITVYWHTSPVNVPTRYIYSVYNNGVYLGNLPNVTSDFQFSQDINTAGSQITVECGVSPDTAILPNGAILDESGNIILDELSNPIYDEGTVPLMELGTGSGTRVIRNGNKVVVTQIDYWHPNGIVVFRGMIQNWQANYGGFNGSDDITILIYSDGSDMDNHLIKGPPFSYTLDQTQTTNDTDLTVYFNSLSIGGSGTFYGQTITIGSGITILGAIAILAKIPSGWSAAPVTVNVYDNPGRTTLLGSSTQTISVSSYTLTQFNFPQSIVVTPGQQYFFDVTVPSGYAITIASKGSGSPYSGGQSYVYNFSNTSAGSFYAMPGSDLYFNTYTTNASTTATYSSVDPTTGMLIPAMNYYSQEGGLITYTSSSIVSTGLSISYKWNTNTMYEGLQGTLSVCPTGYYYTVDLGTNVLTMKPASATADITLIKGYHTESMTLVATIEQIINQVNFTGGIVGGSNIYTVDSDSTSIALYGTHLDRPTNNQILDTTTAHILGGAEVSSRKNEQYSTTVTLTAHKIDFTTVKPGMTVGFAGYGTFVDQLVLQIVRIDFTPEEMTLTLGILPKRLHKAVEQTIRGYIGLQTVDNPTSPS